MSKIKAALLGEPHGTAANRLRKRLLFKYVQLAGHDVCFRCEKKIESVDDLSIEHTKAWQSSEDPVAAFFDLESVAFAHLSCNRSAANVYVAPRKHGIKCYRNRGCRCETCRAAKKIDNAKRPTTLEGRRSRSS